MHTPRHFERLWKTGRYRKLVALIGAGRSPAFPDATCPVVAASAVLVRLGELQQPGSPFADTLDADLAERQHVDGLWDDDLQVTALAVRALREGPAVDRGRQALARLQKLDGGWPALAIGRLPADLPATLAVTSHLLHLPVGGEPNVEAALGWLDVHCTGRQRHTLDLLRARRLLRAAA